MHPDLRVLIQSGWKTGLKAHLIVFFVLWLLLNIYPMPLIAFDAAIVVYSILFWGWFELAKRGMWRAYYRRMYAGKELLWVYAVIHGAWIRTAMVLTYWRVNEWLAAKQGRTDSFVLHVAVYLFDRTMWMLALGVFLLVVYWLFYRDAWVRVDAFYQAVKEKKKHEPFAVKQLERMVCEEFVLRAKGTAMKVDSVTMALKEKKKHSFGRVIDFQERRRNRPSRKDSCGRPNG
ncbi:hypothetical protein [Geobacillus subterraneus]|uniref:Uncharacterized protein n=1 Tax=Geobacillus subterraneus TaxID=129338 RepID=A0A679FQW7_9BACL|nr:hypothetical protein [Geobacillus subterraneus]BBW98958.1 hypothetical protein GsuE55_37910 [Geobacillus subterraneus]